MRFRAAALTQTGAVVGDATGLSGALVSCSIRVIILMSMEVYSGLYYNENVNLKVNFPNSILIFNLFLYLGPFFNQNAAIQLG